MKQLLLIFFGFFVIGYPCEAVTPFGIEEVSLSASGGEAKESKQALIVSSYSNLDWLELDSTLKLYTTSSESSYRYLKMDIRLPKYLPLFKLNTNYQWNEKYEIFEYGLDWNWKPFRGFKIYFGVNTGMKEVFAGENDRYISSWDEERVGFSYNYKDWLYKFRITYVDKSYPNATYYSSEKFNFQQEIYYDINSKLRLGIIYREMTADYPFDNGLTKDYWKEEWEINGRYRQAKNFYWDWNWRERTWEQGFDLYQTNCFYSFGVNWWRRKVYNIAMKVSHSEINYFSTERIYSEEAEDEDYLLEDLKSRIEQRISLNIRRFVGDFEFGVKIDVLDKDYLSECIGDTLTWGLTTSCKWQRDSFKTQLVLGPFNNDDNTEPTYQLKLSYDFK